MTHPVRIKAVTLAAVLVAALIGSAVLASAHSNASPRPHRHFRSSKARALAHAPNNVPTIVLVHGAFADSSSWDAEVDRLTQAGYPVVSFATPLRGVSYDSEELNDLLQTINGPIVLVGHSYAGMVVSQVAAEDPAVKALVYVAAFIPQVGESVNSLNSMFTGSELVPANLHTTNAPGGLTDVYIDQDKYGQVYAGGLSPRHRRPLRRHHPRLRDAQRATRHQRRRKRHRSSDHIPATSAELTPDHWAAVRQQIAPPPTHGWFGQAARTPESKPPLTRTPGSTGRPRAIDDDSTRHPETHQAVLVSRLTGREIAAAAHRTSCGGLDRRRERATAACPCVEGPAKTSPSRRW
jgi:pimeloyl-ACP methyl ester carboxylesterase